MPRKKKKSKDFKVYSGLVPAARSGFGMGGKQRDKQRGKKRRRRKRKAKN